MGNQLQVKAPTFYQSLVDMSPAVHAEYVKETAASKPTLLSAGRGANRTSQKSWCHTMPDCNKMSSGDPEDVEDTAHAGGGVTLRPPNDGCKGTAAANANGPSDGSP